MVLTIDSAGLGRENAVWREFSEKRRYGEERCGFGGSSVKSAGMGRKDAVLEGVQ